MRRASALRTWPLAQVALAALMPLVLVVPATAATDEARRDDGAARSVADDPRHGALALVPAVLRGCAPRLLGDAKHPFVEAQLACDAYLAFALTDEILDGGARAPREEALHALAADARTRGMSPFPKRSVLGRGWELALLAGVARVGALTPGETARFDALASGLVDDLAPHQVESADRSVLGRRLALGSAGAADGVATDAPWTAEPPWLESFRGGIWPCDHALAASGLVLHGRLRGDTRTEAAGRALARRLDDARRRPSGFPTRVDARGNAIEPLPRGTVLAWTAAFLALGGLDEARGFASDLLDGFCAPAPIPGALACREWPRGVDRSADAVSGPIVNGWGSGASALAIGAARANGRTTEAEQLDNLATAAAFMLRGERPLERAILAWGRGARPWG